MAAAFPESGFVNKLSYLPRIARADKLAAQECVEVYGAMIWTLAKQFTDSNEKAEKAVQEIFIDIWENATFCDLAVSAEENWIVLIARRRLAQYSPENNFPVNQVNVGSPNQNNGIVA